MTFYQFYTGETPLNVCAFVFAPLQVKPGGFLLFVGEISVAMEHWISPSMWVRRDPLSQDREQLLPRYHHSLHPWQGLWLLDSCTTNPPHHFCFSSTNTEILQSRRDLYRIPEEDTQVCWSCKKRRKHVLHCIWAQITEKRPQQINKQKIEGDSTPGFSMRCVGTESNTAQQPWGN